jgi:hypothetical protein
MAKDPSAEAEKIFIELGKALSRWSILEDTLCTAFCLATGNANTFPNSHAFWAIISFDAKLRMTHSVLTVRFRGNAEILSMWARAYSKLSRKKEKRNKLAHGTVVTFNFKPKGKAMESHTHLCPYYMSAMRKLVPEDILKTGDPRPKDRLSAADITAIERAFKSTDDSLRKVCEAMYEELNKLKSGAQAA